MPPVLHSPAYIIKNDDGSIVSGMTSELTYGECNNSRMNQLEPIMRGQEYDNETGNRPQASISGDMRPNCPMFPTEQPSNLGLGGAGYGVDASKSSTRVTTDPSSTTATTWMTLCDRMLFRGAIFLALVVPICLFGYFAASGVFRGGRGGAGFTANPTPAPGSSQGGTCGDGNVGNGICLDVTLCCSKFGFCGTTIEHCSDQGLTEEPMVPFSSPGPSEWVGTCGEGNIGNAICLDTTLCCSKYGWCGSTTEHCAAWDTTSSPTSGPTFGGTHAPTPTVPGGGTCGDGNVGNGICSDTTLCCSKFGWCANTTEHCADWETTSSPTSAPSSSRAGGTQAPISSPTSIGVRTSPPTPTASSTFSYGGALAVTSAPTSRPSPPTPTVSYNSLYGGNLALISAPTSLGGGETLAPSPPALFSIEGGTCGEGTRGNGICPDVTACCSYFGWCGSGPNDCGYRNLRARGTTN
jgi:hypothetical protein